MTRWVRWERAWHVLDDGTVGEHAGLQYCGTLCGRGHFAEKLLVSDLEPVEDECRHCRRALDGGKQ